MRYEKGSRLLTRKQQEWAYDKWCNGYTCAEIADALYCSDKTVYRVLKGKDKVKKPLYYDVVRDCGA